MTQINPTIAFAHRPPTRAEFTKLRLLLSNYLKTLVSVQYFG